MKKRELFVFAGQSNMMGASVYSPKIPIDTVDSFEYKHRSVLRGGNEGEFVKAGYPCGEFSYIDTDTAYSPEHTDKNGNSDVSNYLVSTHFCPAMSNLKDDDKKEIYPFAHFNEQNIQMGASLAPLFATEWEKLGNRCTYAHLAKGCVSIFHYFDIEMANEYNRKIDCFNKLHGTDYKLDGEAGANPEACEYFATKVTDFFREAKLKFADDDTSCRPFVWIQGESESLRTRDEYRIALEVLWGRCKKLGFTHCLIPRIDYFGAVGIYRVMQGEEDFCSLNEGCAIVTRALSFMPYHGQDTTDWYAEQPSEDYNNCRDSFYGYENQHINEKGFAIVAKRMADNAQRLLHENKPTILEKEIILPIIREDTKNV